MTDCYRVKIYLLGLEFYSGQDTHVHTDVRTDGLSVILGFAPALNEPLRNNYYYKQQMLSHQIVNRRDICTIDAY